MIVHGSKASTGLMTLYTVPSTGKFYLKNLFLSYVKDVLCDCIITYVSLIPFGKVATLLIPMMSPTTTIGERSAGESYDQGIRLNPGSTVTVEGTFSAGTMTRRASLVGIHIEE